MNKSVYTQHFNTSTVRIVCCSEN